MANPTLIAQDTPWAGFTMDSIVEALLGMRGLTNDATTGRTVAITAEDTEARRFVREAIDDLHARFPTGAWAVRQYSAAWVAGDHSVALPANTQSILAVTWNGLSMRPLSRDDLYRIQRGDDEGGGVESEDTGEPRFYRVVGFSNTNGTDPRIVLRLYPTPDTAETLVVEYVSSAPALTTGTHAVPMGTPLQRWVKWRAAEVWASERGDSALLANAERERDKVEQTLHSWFEQMREHAARATTRRPHVTRSKRYR